MRLLGLPFLASLHGLGPVALRLGVGFNFIWFGNKKISRGVDSFADYLSDLGVANPLLFAWLVVIAELVGGAFLVAGLLTRLVTLPLIATMVGAIFLVKAELGMPDVGIDVALLAGLTALLLHGPGRFSVDRLLGVEPSRTNPASPPTVEDAALTSSPSGRSGQG